jgi:tetratricopeptide (TPR) repeat protein
MRNEAETALQLDPGLAEAHRARAFWFYWCEHDYGAALADFETARQAAPNDFDIVGDIAAIRRRQGRWDEALAGFEQVAKQDPQNAANASELTFTLSFMRRWPEAAASAKRAIILAPDFLNLRIRAAYVEFWWKDDTGALRQLVESSSPEEDPDGLLTLARWDLALLEHDYAAAERALNACKLKAVVPYGTPLPIDYLRGCTELARNNFAASQPLLEKTRSFFEAQVQAIPDDPFRQATLALVYSYLGRNEEAIRFARQATALLPESRDAILGASYQANLAIVLGRAGEKDEAINLLTHALTLPTGTSATETNITVPDLRRRWQWDPLRGDPRFAKLVASPTPK